MKVGVYLSDRDPVVGGGYTIENDIFQCLLDIAKESHHHFIIFSNQGTDILANHSKPSNLEFVQYHRSFSDKLVSILSTEQPRFYKLLKQFNRLESLVSNTGVEIIWFVGQNFIPIDLPYITVIWDLQHRLQPWFPEVSANGEWLARERIFNYMLQRSTVIIAGNELGKKEIERFYQVPSERIKLLPHPTPKFVLDAPPDRDKKILTKYNIPENYLFYPAQFWTHKNHAGLLLAVKFLRDNYDLIFPVVFVGSDQGNLQYIKQLTVKLDLSKQVHFLGFVSQEDLINLYRNAFALTYLTFFGPENLPPLEAFALGCPVVASKVSGSEEQLGDAALLVDPKDEKQIALAIKSLYEDSEFRNTLIQRGLARTSKWTGYDYIRGLFSILDELEPFIRCWSA